MSYDFKGTPGQWFLSNVVNSSGEMVYVIQGECATEICNVWDCDACSAEDARAIAAVPELIEALDNARDWIDSCGAQGGVQEILDKTESALTKATGGDDGQA